MKDKIKVAICYDFDKTLSPCNMQEFGFMDALGTTPNEFWDKSDTLAAQGGGDNNLAYMWLMLDESRRKGIGCTKDDFMKYGESIKLFNGVEEWFKRINAYGKELDIEVEHYLISSGLEDIVAGTTICKEFKQIYANKYFYDANGVPYWPSQLVNSTGKTEFMFRISKGCLNPKDRSVNNKTEPDSYKIPFTNMLYIGDGFTDVPCMSILRKYGGHTIGVYPPRKKGGSKTAKQLMADGRLDIFAPADYSEGSKIDNYVKSLLRKIKADYDLLNQ